MKIGDNPDAGRVFKKRKKLMMKRARNEAVNLKVLMQLIFG